MKAVPLFFRTLGQGQPLVILHGLYGMSDNWLSIAKDLSRQFLVVLPDLRNHGRSPHAMVHTYQAMSEDVAWLLDQLGIEQCILLGHSMGGKTAMFFAGRYPQRLLKLIVVDIAPADLRNSSRGSLHEKQHREIIEALRKLDLSKIHSRTDADQQLAVSLPNNAIRHFLLKNTDRRPDGSFRWMLNLDVLAARLPFILEGFPPEQHQEYHLPVKVPALFLRGARSNYIIPEDFPQILELFPMATAETIPEAGHWVHAEQPAAFLRAVLTFLTEDSALR